MKSTYAEYIKHPILTKERERALAISYEESGNVQAREQLILHNLRFVHSIAHEYKFDRSQIDDLIQQGMIGLCIAPSRWKQEKNVTFNSYASWWIRAFILKYITNNFALVKMGTTNNQRKIFWSLSKERSKLEAMGIDPTAELLAETLDVKKEEVEEMTMRMSGAPVSINTSYSDESLNAVEAKLPSPPTPEKLYTQAQFSNHVQGLVAEFKETLVPMHQLILEKRIVQEEPDTLAAIAEEVGRSRERIRQLELKIKKKMRAFFKENDLG